MTTEQIILSLDISTKKLKSNETADLHKKISQDLDKTLREADSGRWVDGYCDLDIMVVCIQTEKPDSAIPIIKSTLAGHQFYPQDKISTRAK